MVGRLPRVVATHWVHPEVTDYLKEFSAPVVPPEEPGVWPAALRFLDRTGLDLSPIQTHFFPLADGVAAFDFGKKTAECIKITMTNED